MLKKLYRYEYYSLFRSMFPVYIGLLCLALIGRLIYLFENDSFAYQITVTLSSTFYFVAIAALFIVGMVIVVTRFYKNLLTGQGYLTFSLPFTPTRHIVCKLLCGATVTVLNFIVVVASLLILSAGTNLQKEIFGSLREGWRYAATQYSSGRLAGVGLEFLLFALASVFSGILMFYAAIAIGQQFKSKIGSAVAAYVCLNAINQALSSVMLMVLFGMNSEVIERYFNDGGLTGLQIYLIFPICLSLALGTAYFFVTRYFLTKKLNLE